MSTTKEQYNKLDTAIFPQGKSAYDKQSFGAVSQGLFYAHVVGRTLQGDYDYIFVPDYVFYVGKYPSAYIKTVERFSEPDIRKWQQFLWNQAVVPFLIVKTRTQLRVYSATTKPQEKDSGEAIEQILETTADALDSLKARLETGDFYAENLDKLGRENRVDQYLLDNLKAVANEMAKTQGAWNKDNLQFAHRFLTRILFVCYLIERGMIKGKHFPKQSVLRQLRSRKESKPFLLKDLLKSLSTVTKRKDAIVAIFKYVKKHFNGSLFEESISSESKKYREDFLDLLLKFLEGHEIASGQLTLGFWAYDFSVIPIEMISSVYDGFLKSEGEIDQSVGNSNSQSEAGAYYTPPHLAELAVDMALEGNEMPIHELTVIDPACGSGVFLVAMFGRMAQSLRQKMDYKGKRISPRWGSAVLDILPKLYGIDINPTACHITCFSLYLAALEQMSPMDVVELQKSGQKFPSLLLDKPNRIEAGKNIIRGNFFDVNIPLTKSDFDLVVGNPPWVSRGKQKDKDFLKWRSLEGSAAEKVRGPDKQIAHGFMWKTADYLKDTGKACLLLPSAVFLNSHTNIFQEKWLSSITLERAVNFSDLSFVLFEGADRPCMAVRFSPQTSDNLDYKIRLESPKLDVRSQQGGPVYIREEDTVYLQAKRIIEASHVEKAPEVWKSRFWGTWRDQKLLSRLMYWPKLSDKVEETKTFSRRVRQGDTERKYWLRGQGVIRGKATSPGWWNQETLYISGTDIPSIAVNESSCVKVRDADFPLKAHRPRIKELFLGPKVLISQGSQNMKVAFCGFDVLFQDALQAIAGLPEDADLLRFLSVVIKSDIAQYYLFHTSANWGTERNKVHFHELLSLPFCFPEETDDPKAARKIVDKVAEEIRNFEKRIESQELFDAENESACLREKLEPLIRRYYDVNSFETILIDDTIKTIIPSARPNDSQIDIPTLKQATLRNCLLYADSLCDVLAVFAGKDTEGKESKTPFSATVYHGNPYTIVQVDKVSRARKIRTEFNSEKIKEILSRLESILDEQVGSFTFCKNLKVFCDETLYIIKPSQSRFWLKTAALNDADEIMSAILVANEGEKI